MYKYVYFTWAFWWLDFTFNICTLLFPYFHLSTECKDLSYLRWVGGQKHLVRLLVVAGIKVADTQRANHCVSYSTHLKKQHCLNPSAVHEVEIFLNLT